MIVIFLPCVAPARGETQASSLGIADASRLPGHRTAVIGMACQRSAVKNAGRGCAAPSVLSECHLLTARRR